MQMNKLPPFSQLSKLVFLLIFILLTPLVPSSLRPPYLYFLFNLLVVALGIESGLLKAIASSHEEKGPNFFTHTTTILHPSMHNGTNVMTKTKSIAAIANQALAKPIEKAKIETSLGGIIGVNKLKKCASRPSIFFIGGLESEQECRKENKKENKKEEKEEQWNENKKEEREQQLMEAQEMTKQELFAKAESFIGNFYRQLKMQREESWKKIHGLYQKAF